MFEDYPDILSPEEAAEALRIGENAIYELLNSKKLSAYKNGRNWLIPKEAVRKYVVEQSKLEFCDQFKDSLQGFVDAFLISNVKLTDF